MFKNDIYYVRYLTDVNEELAKVNKFATDYINSRGLLADEMAIYYFLY